MWLRICEISPEIIGNITDLPVHPGSEITEILSVSQIPVFQYQSVSARFCPCAEQLASHEDPNTGKGTVWCQPPYTLVRRRSVRPSGDPGQVPDAAAVGDGGERREHAHDPGRRSGPRVCPPLPKVGEPAKPSERAPPD